MLKKRSALFILCLCVALITFTLPAQARSSFGKVDEVVVYKGARIMELIKNDKVVKRYKVALGFNPVGHKIFEGDGRTPVGRYFLTWRNEESQFHRSINISYPDTADKAVARSLGYSPGGLIMIHGLPNDVSNKKEINHPYVDWTDGCIAVTNEEMDEIWQAVGKNTPITIRP